MRFERLADEPPQVGIRISTRLVSPEVMLAHPEVNVRKFVLYGSFQKIWPVLGASELLLP